MAYATSFEAGMIARSDVFVGTLARAADYAAGQGHPAITLEHLLLALTEDSDAAGVLTASSVDLHRLRNEVAAFIGQQPPAATMRTSPVPDAELTKILTYAEAAARQSGRSEINGAIVLLAILGEGRSMAATFLKAQGLTFQAAIKIIQQVLAPPPAPPEPAAAPPSPEPEAPAPEAEAPPAASPPAEPPASTAAPDASPAPPAVEEIDRARSAFDDYVAPAPRAPQPAAPFPRPSIPEVQRPDREVLGIPSIRRPDPPPRAPAPAPRPQPQPPHKTDESAEAAPPAPAQDAPKSAPPPEPAPPPAAPPPARAEPSRPDSTPRAPMPPAPPTDDATPRAPQPAAQPSTVGRPPPLPARDPARPAAGPPPIPPSRPTDAAPEPASPAGGPPPPAPTGLGAPRPAPPRPGLRLPPNPLEGHQITAPWPEPTNDYRAPQIPPSYPPPRPPAARAPQHPTDPRAARDAPARGPRPPPGPGRPPVVEKGQLVENIPRRMKVGVTETFEVRISREGVMEAGQGLPGRGEPQYHAIRITRAMSVRLKGEPGRFYIESASPETQWTGSQNDHPASDYAVWRFTVIPQTRGPAELTLIVSARSIGADGVVADSNLPEQRITVRVSANVTRGLKRWAGWAAIAVLGAALGKVGEHFWGQAIGLVRSLLPM